MGNSESKAKDAKLFVYGEHQSEQCKNIPTEISSIKSINMVNKYRKLMLLDSNDNVWFIGSDSNWDKMVLDKWCNFGVSKIINSAQNNAVFLVTKKGKLYGSRSYALPRFIPTKFNVIDMQCGDTVYYVLYGPTINHVDQINDIVYYWNRHNYIPAEVIEMIKTYFDIGNIWREVYRASSRNVWKESGWQLIKEFQEENICITQIAVADKYALFLTDDGSVYGSANSDYVWDSLSSKWVPHEPVIKR